MGKTLIIAEKPSVGKEIARVLSVKQHRDGAVHGDKYIVTWALGHLVTLADPEHYGEMYKKWSLETLPMLPKKMDLTIIQNTGKQYNVIKNLLRSSEVSEIVIATDAGREGELVARWIIEKAGVKKPIKRLWISSQTDKAIKEGFSNLKSGKDYENLYRSAVARSEADWIVGLNITRALTCKFNAQLSAGRVQTPTLAMIVEREDEIKKFVPKDYYNINANMGSFKALWKDKNNQSGLYDEIKAREIENKIRQREAVVTNVKKENKMDLPPLLYDLTELQRDANKRYGYTAKRTLDIMQKLYETHKMLTYPRTDSRYLTTDIVPTLAHRLKCVNYDDHGKYIMEIVKRGIRVSKRMIDNSKVTDHHAIIPTDEFANVANLDADERRIYDMVVKRFIAALSDEFRYEKITVEVEIEGEKFSAKGKTVTSAGWKALYGISSDDEEDGIEGKDQNLPKILKGDKFKVLEGKAIKLQTKPPARYTEGTLLTAMEHPSKLITDSQMKTVIDNAKGIGTSATRADIIEKLFSSNYVERRGKEIFPLSKGIQLISLVPKELKSPLLTAEWEYRLERISNGKESGKEFNDEIRKYAQSLVGSVIASNASYRHDNLTRKRCPLCDKFLLEINGKRGKMLACVDRECGYKLGISMESNARCPNCKKKMEILGEGEKRIYKCKCGFREKFEKFNAFLKENSNKSNKKEVENFMRKQKEELKNELSPLALAFAKAKASENEEKK